MRQATSTNRISMTHAQATLLCRHKLAKVLACQEMTVWGNSAGDSLQCKVNRDILFKLLWQKPSIKSRREIIHSAGSSFPSHISRKLMLEEHKLELQLEQIEKERKQFLNKNSNAKHLLQLSLRTAKTTERRRNSSQYLVMNDNVRCHSTDQKHSIEGGDIYRKSWHSTNGVFYPCGAKNVKQLQVNKVYLMHKRAEQNRVRGSLPWKRNFDMPQVPPPSRSPSQTNIIWVHVRSKSDDMDGFLKTKENCQEITPEKKTDNDTGKKEDRGQGKGTASLGESVLRADKNTTFENSYDEDIRQVQRLECSFCQNDKQSPDERKLDWTYEEAPDATSLQHEALTEQLAPTVKGLKVLPNEIRRHKLLKQKSEEKLKNEQEQYEDNEFKTTQRNDSGTSCGTRRSTDDEINHVLKDRVKRVNPYLDGKTSDRHDVGCDRERTVTDRPNIVANKLNNVSEWLNITSDGESDRQKVRRDRPNIGTDLCIPTDAKTTKESKRKQNGRKTRESSKNSPTKMNKRESAQKFVHIKPNVQELGVFAKTFTVTSGSICKGGTEKNTTRQESKKCLFKPHSATRLKAKKSYGTKLPRKSCSACAVKMPLNDDSLRAKREDFRSTSDTSAGNQARRINTAGSDGSSQGKKPQSPVPIVLPSQSQLQNFDKVAKNNLRKTLAIKLRRYCYTGTWAFPAAKIRKNETE